MSFYWVSIVFWIHDKRCICCLSLRTWEHGLHMIRLTAFVWRWHHPPLTCACLGLFLELVPWYETQLGTWAAVTRPFEKQLSAPVTRLYWHHDLLETYIQFFMNGESLVGFNIVWGFSLDRKIITFTLAWNKWWRTNHHPSSNYGLLVGCTLDKGQIFSRLRTSDRQPFTTGNLISPIHLTHAWKMGGSI